MSEYFHPESNIGKRLSGWIEAGEVGLSHAHKFPHDTFILDGAFQIDVLKPTVYDSDGIPTEFETLNSTIKKRTDSQPWVLILAGTWHRITCLERGRYMCVFASRDNEGRVTDKYDGWPDAFQ